MVARKDTRVAAHTDCMRGVVARRDSLVEGRTGWGSLEGSRDRVLGAAAWPGGVAVGEEAVAVARLAAVVRREAVPLLMPRAAVQLRPAQRAAPAVRKTTTPRLPQQQVAAHNTKAVQHPQRRSSAQSLPLPPPRAYGSPH